MTTVTTSSLSDTLPLTVPKLDAEGENWGIFFIHFMDAVKSKGFWGHFDDSLLTLCCLPSLQLPKSLPKISGTKKSDWQRLYLLNSCLI